MAKLKVNNLSIRFGGLNALSNLSFEVPDKSFVGFLGPNGAGKTTVINCISRIYNPQQGEIFFDGQDVLKLSGDEVLRLGISRTFQDLNFLNGISNMLIIDYLKLGQFDPNKISLWRDSFHTQTSIMFERDLKRRARRVLEFFREMRDQLEPSQESRGYPYLLGREGFPDLIDVEFKPISILSFAWRRRLDLARALVSSPKLLLLDEPAQGLPPTEIENLGKTLKLIQAELGASALIVEHNVETVAKISDHMIAMNLGKKVIEGAPAEVISNPEVIKVYLGDQSEKTQEAEIAIQPEAERSGAPLLEIKNIDLYYGSAQALFSVSMKFYPKQITSILGTNGSGKSTLLKALSGVEKPSFGDIIFHNQTIPVGWPELMVERGMQYVPQGHVVFPELTVMQNLKIGALDFKLGIEKINHYFPELKNHFNEQAASLSGGQRQMLAIGQALMRQPTLLLLDEPSLGLSPILVNKLFDIIKKIKTAESCTVIIVEQNVQKALEISDYVYLMSSGVVIGEGPSKTLRENNTVVKNYLGFN